MRFVLIAQQRTGTTLFRSLLNRDPSVHIYNEAFFPSFFKWGWYSYLRDKAREDPDIVLPPNWTPLLVPYLEGLFDRQEHAGKLVVGVDVKIPQAEYVRVLPRAVRKCGAGVLHIRRRNTLASIVSYRIMTERVKQGGRAHGISPAERATVNLNIDWLQLRVAEFELEDRMVKWNYRELPHLELFYEDFVGPAGWARSCTQLSDFFGYRFDVPFEPALQKQNSANLAEIIENAEEVQLHFPQFFEPVAADR